MEPRPVDAPRRRHPAALASPSSRALDPRGRGGPEAEYLIHMEFARQLEAGAQQAGAALGPAYRAFLKEGRAPSVRRSATGSKRQRKSTARRFAPTRKRRSIRSRWPFNIRKRRPYGNGFSPMRPTTRTFTIGWRKRYSKRERTAHAASRPRRLCAGRRRGPTAVDGGTEAKTRDLARFA